MKTFVCRLNPVGHTLLENTDLSIVEAASAIFPDTVDCFLGEPAEEARKHIAKMREAYLSGKPFLTIDASGNHRFQDAPDPIERHRFSYYSDAPYLTYYDNIIATPDEFTVTYSDRSFRHFFEDINPKFNYIFMPHGGPNKIENNRPMTKRKQNITFVGRVVNPHPAGGFEQLLINSDPKLIAIAKEASETCMETQEDPYLAFRAASLRVGVNPFEIMSAENLKTLLGLLTHWVEMQFRTKILRAFKDSQIHFVGPVTEEIKGITDQDHHFYGNATGPEVMAHMANTRVLLNSCAVFKNGSHERIWFGMANGAVVYTDYSNFVAETFEDKKDILFINYDDMQNDAEMIDEISRDPARLQDMRDQASKLYLDNHTWQKRLESTFSQMPYLTDAYHTP